MKFYTNKQTLFISLSICLVLTALMFCSIFMLDSEKAYADYEDIINDPNSIVNFNQIVNYSNLSSSAITFSNDHFVLNGTFVANDWIFTSIYANLDNTHKYYFYVKQDNPHVEIVFDGTQLRNDVTYIGQPTQSIQSPLYFKTNSAGTYTNFNVYFYCIDLTLMFGSNDNIPTLEQCNQLFVANYYSYNTGTAMSIGSVNAYQQALNDIMSSYKFELTTSALGLNSFGYNYKNQSSYFQYNTSANAWYFLNTFGTPLYTTLSNGTRITITYNLWGPNSGYQEHLHLAVSYINSNGDFSTFSIDPSGINFYSDEVQQYVVTLPTSLDILYFSVFDDRTQAIDTIANFYVLEFTINADSFDINTAITQSYLSGQQSLINLYSEGGERYESIWQAGYTVGLSEDNPYTFSRLMTAVIEAPLGAVLSIFNFEFMGYNFKNVITLVLTICLILAVIRLFVGGN